MSNPPFEMTRSVSQLLFSYLPDRTVSWEDGGGIVRLGTPRIDSVCSATDASFVLSEVAQYLERWRTRGEVDRRFPPFSQTERFSVGTPRGISATLLSTAFYCRRCFRFLPRVRGGAGNLRCPDCRRPTLRQISYLFVHGCGELVPIRDKVPYESPQRRGTIYWGPIRCRRCGDHGLLRLDARSERLSALKITCDRCGGEVIGRPLARCPYCLPRLFAPDGEQPTQLAFRTAMRITRHSANNAYYAHSINVLRLDKPRTVQISNEVTRLQKLLPEADRQPATGVADALTDLVTRLAAAEASGDSVLAAEIRDAISVAAQAHPTPAQQQPENPAAPNLEQDVSQSVRESIALLSTVNRTDVTLLDSAGPHPIEASGEYGTILESMGLSHIELVEDLPVVTAVFGYSRRSATPDYEEEGAAQPFPTTLRPFPTLDDDAARILGRPQVAGTTPILAREGVHEGLAIYLDPSAVLQWLETNGVRLEGETLDARLGNMLGRLEPVQKFYDDIWECPVRRLAYGLLHSVSHCAMRALGRTAGLEDTSVSEYLFMPLLCAVVYSTSNTNLGGVRTTASERLLEFLDTVQEGATRCLYDPDCLQHTGACHGCLHVPEIGCRVFNHGLSRAFLIGGHTPWTPAGDQSTVSGYWQQTDDR